MVDCRQNGYCPVYPENLRKLDRYAVPHELVTDTNRIVHLIEIWGPILLLAGFWVMLLTGKIKTQKQDKNSIENTTKEIDNLIK